MGLNMNNHTCLITGAGGLVGSSLAEACVKRGYKVKALIRSGSDGSFLEKLGVEVVRGDLQDKNLPKKQPKGWILYFTVQLRLETGAQLILTGK